MLATVDSSFDAAPRHLLLRCVQLLLSDQLAHVAGADAFVRKAMQLCHIQAHPTRGPVGEYDRKIAAFIDLMEDHLDALPDPAAVCVCSSCTLLYKGHATQLNPPPIVRPVDPAIQAIADHLCEVSVTDGLQNALKKRLTPQSMEMTLRSVTVGFPLMGRRQQEGGSYLPASVNATHVLAYTSKFGQVPLSRVRDVLSVVLAAQRARDALRLHEKRQQLLEGLPTLCCDDICELVRGGRAVAGEGASGSVRVGILRFIGYINWWAWPTREIALMGSPTPPPEAFPFPPLVALKLVSVPVFDQRRFRMMALEASLLQRLTIDFGSMNARMKTVAAVVKRLQKHLSETDDLSVAEFLSNLSTVDGITNPSVLLPFDWGGDSTGCPHGNLVAGIAALPFDGIKEEDAVGVADIPTLPPPPPTYDGGDLPPKVAALEQSDRDLLNRFWGSMQGSQVGSILLLPSAALHLNARQRSQICPHRAAFVLEYCDGGTLRSFMESDCGGRPLAPKMVSALFFPVLLGLDMLHHDFGVLHRDLKPENILLCREDSGVNARGTFLPQQLWRVKVADYGISKPMGDAKTACGTHRYMAPEVRNAILLSRLAEHEEHKASIKGADFIGSRSMYGKAADIYSLGVVLQYLLSGGDNAALGTRWVSPDLPHTMDGAEEEEDISPEHLVSLSYGRPPAKPLQYDGNGRRLSNPQPGDDSRWCHQSAWKVPTAILCKCAVKDMAGVCKCGGVSPIVVDLLNSMTSVVPARRPTIQELFLHPFVTQYGSFEPATVAGHALWQRTTFSPRSAAVQSYFRDGEGATLTSLYPLLTFVPQSLAFLGTKIHLHASRSTQGVRAAVERALHVPDDVAAFFESSTDEDSASESSVTESSASVDSLRATTLNVAAAARPSRNSPSPNMPMTKASTPPRVLVRKVKPEAKVGGAGWSCCKPAPPKRPKPSHRKRK